MTRSPTLPHDPQRVGSSFAAWAGRATLVCLFLLAAAAPLSIAATQAAWLLGMLCWVARFLLRPRPALRRTAVDYALLGLFILSFVSALFSYEPDLSIGKLRAASLFTIVYLVAQNVMSRRALSALVFVLVASCAASTIYTFGAFAAGRGVKVGELTASSPLRAAGVREGDTLLSVDGAAANSPEEAERAITTERQAAEKTYRWPDGKVACVWDARAACVRVYRAEVVPTYLVPRDGLAGGATPAERLGIARWSRGRDERATGFYGQYQTYSEVLQLIASVVLGLLVARARLTSRAGLLCDAAFAAMCGALLLTVTRASWAGLLLSSLTIILAGASRRTVLVFALVAAPLVVAGALVLRQKRGVGFLDRSDQSTTWRGTVWREGAQVLASKPRHLIVGVGMDSLKRRWREWGMFDRGRLPWGHLHSTPLQIAFERGLPALAAWLALLFIYARTSWRLARRAAGRDWIARGLALGALGGAVGFFSSGFVHYNLGDSEVVMVFYIIMGLTLAAERLCVATE
ncbi:MAG: O-antigen ligase family protein [Pyrinomonadaceae bacterium]